MNANGKRRLSAAIGQLIVDRKFQVARTGNDLTLIKMIGKRPVTINLRRVEAGFWIDPPTQNYLCTNSHYDYHESENRFTRRKTVILSVVAQLQKTKLWEFIANKQFFEPNENNRKMKKSLVVSEYKSILGLR